MIATVVERPAAYGQCGCGLYPDEHCGSCGQCPGWHEIDCDTLREATATVTPPRSLCTRNDHATTGAGADTPVGYKW
jgi:hypothetical protein